MRERIAAAHRDIVTSEHRPASQLAGELRNELGRSRGICRAGHHAGPAGARVIDAGVDSAGGYDAGLALAEICMGGLGSVALAPGDGETGGLTQVHAHSADPIIACLASQYAGWSLAATKEETGGKKFFSLGSGPARALAGCALRWVGPPLMAAARLRTALARIAELTALERTPLPPPVK